MKVVLICRDKPGAHDIRAANRDAHLAYAAETGAVWMGGPFLDEAGNMTGSLIILEIESLEAAKAWSAADPYVRAGLFESVTIDAWKKTVG
ncbi:YciI family protein [Rhodovulum sp. 12E13]|uniref:YciI family protein n=1 Tax=Rhodovulum sp. 12E13 TaxID=2203891 RepID=UPI000E19FE4D|nr:YciI family protein [Rhodovulum sp. 12E13]RDC74776.1 YciI family protein [Rhodovulum sp. 12E13]